jgi:hypothetical protein
MEITISTKQEKNSTLLTHKTLLSTESVLIKRKIER